mgnify:FL=1
MSIFRPDPTIFELESELTKIQKIGSVSGSDPASKIGSVQHLAPDPIRHPDPNTLEIG